MALRLISYSYGAVRSRALAAGLLKHGQIGELLDCGSKSEAESWLGKKIDVQAEEIELGLHERFIVFGRKVARSLPASGREFILVYLSRAQVENLKALCRALLTGRLQQADQTLLSDPPGKILTAHAAAAGNMEEMCERLPRGTYRDVVRAALKADPEERLFRVESGLERTFWERMREQSGPLAFFDRRAAQEILDMRADIERFRVVGRGIKAGLPASTILESLPCFGSLLPVRRLRSALKSEEPAAAVMRLMTGIGDDPLATDVEPLLLRRLHRYLRRLLVSPPFDISVPLSAVLLMELETRDLKAVFGGKRLGREREEIRSFLSCIGA